VPAYSIVVKYSGKTGLNKLTLKHFSESLSVQINNPIRKRLEDEGILISSVGYVTLQKHSLLPEPGSPLQVKKIYEAFLQFDDKPMVLNADAVRESLLKYCVSGEFAVASGKPGDFNRYFYKESVPFFDIEDTQYWIFHKKDVPEPAAPEPEGETVIDGGEEEGGASGGVSGDLLGGENEQIKTFKSVTISGNVDVANYNQIFTSFIVPLKSNKVQVEVKIKGVSTEASPINESSDQYKITKESAKQLGLEFDVEE